MSLVRSRLARLRISGRFILAAVVGSVTVAAALTYWADRLGYRAIAVIGVVGLIVVALSLVAPDHTWQQLTGTDTLRADLGELHAEGALLRHRLPWVSDQEAEQLDAWERDANEWLARVQRRLHGTPWLGTFLTPVNRGGIRYGSPEYKRAQRYRDQIDGWLERLSQIVASAGS